MLKYEFKIHFDDITLNEQTVISIFNFALHLTKDFDIAEDVFQDAMLKGYVHKDTYKGKGEIKSWFLKIVENTYKSRFKSNVDYLLLDNHEEEFVLESNLESSCYISQLKEIVQTLLMQLSDKQGRGDQYCLYRGDEL